VPSFCSAKHAEQVNMPKSASVKVQQKARLSLGWPTVLVVRDF